MKASVKAIVERLKTLPANTLADVLSYVDFVAWRSHQSSDANRSAEARAIDRLPDKDSPKMWVTVMNPGDDIDPNAYDQLRLNARNSRWSFVWERLVRKLPMMEALGRSVDC